MRFGRWISSVLLHTGFNNCSHLVATLIGLLCFADQVSFIVLSFLGVLLETFAIGLYAFEALLDLAQFLLCFLMISAFLLEIFVNDS